jgi:hypothetical protein
MGVTGDVLLAVRQQNVLQHKVVKLGATLLLGGSVHANTGLLAGRRRLLRP